MLSMQQLLEGMQQCLHQPAPYHNITLLLSLFFVNGMLKWMIDCLSMTSTCTLALF